MRNFAILSAAATVVLAAFASPIARAQGVADLTLSISASPEPVVADQDLTYLIRLTNEGPEIAEGTTMIDTLPPDAMFRSASGTPLIGAGQVTWRPGPIASGESVRRTLVLEPIHPGPTENVVDATTTSSDPTTPNETTITSTVEAEPGVHYVAVRDDAGFRPPFHSLALGETVQWDVFGSATDPPHDITDAHGLGLFDSGPMEPVSYYRFTFTLSAEIRTMDDPLSYPENHGKLVILPQVSPASGSQTDTYTVMLATAPLGDFVEDVQIKRPGDTRWSPWEHGTTVEKFDFTPDRGMGQYYFRDRIRRAGTKIHSRFGPPVELDVTS
jgi:uncharacterized repeat protein (TIGR01451 family)